MVNLQHFNNVLVIEDKKNRRIISLEEDVYFIGRDLTNSIVIYEDRRVSRHHATILRKKIPQTNDYSYWILDGDLHGNRSTNGILVNGKSRLAHELKHGDAIIFGGEAKANYYILNNISIIDFFKSGGIENQLVLEQQTFFLKQDSLETLTLNHQLERLSQEDLFRLASFPELSPNPIIEINLNGDITYLNPTAMVKFPKIYQAKLEHPILAGLVSETKNRNGNLFVREIKIDEEIFEQYVHYLSENGLIRSYIFDFTERKEMEAELRESEERYRAVVKQSLEGIFLVDTASKKFIEANAAYCKLLGYTNKEILELTLYDVIALNREEVDSHIARLLSEKLPQESLYKSKNGSLINVEISASQIRYGGKDLFCFAVRDITERKRTEKMLQHQAFHDLLTNLPNRTLFNEQLLTALANAKRHQKLMAVMFLDIDNFKNINDSWGQQMGDRLLKNFAERLKSCFRQGDTVARWGGDEFTILLPEISSAEEAAKISQRILNTLKPPFELEDKEIYVTSNIGVALYPQDGEDVETLLRNADAALYRTKQEGKNKNSYSFHKPTTASKSDLLLTRENLFCQALEREEFYLDYQPQINIRTGEVCGMEALLRWQHPQLGIVFPGEFITLAEETGSILPIGEWVLYSACHQNKIWHSAGFGPFKIAVNISPLQLQQPDVSSKIAKILQETGLTPDLLELEITENSIIKSLDNARGILKDLQQMGIRISIDDFGNGYSSLGYLRKFPFHALKIGKSLIQNLKNEPQDIAMISAVVAWGRNLNLRVIAEGVETKQQLELLQSLQCEEMQGYWFSQPLNPQEATRFLSWRGSFDDRPA